MQRLPIEITRIILGEFIDTPLDINSVELTCKAWLKMSRERTHLSSDNQLMNFHLIRYPNLKVVNAWLNAYIAFEILNVLQGTIRISEEDSQFPFFNKQVDLAATHTVIYRCDKSIYEDVECRGPGRKMSVRVGCKNEFSFVLTSNTLEFKLDNPRKVRDCERLIRMLSPTYSVRITGIRKIPELIKPLRTIKLVNAMLITSSSTQFIAMLKMITDKVELEGQMNPYWIRLYREASLPKPRLFIDGKLVE